MGFHVFQPVALEFLDRGDGSGRMLAPISALGEPPERHELPRGTVCVVQPGTPLQLRNDGDEDVLFLIVGAPPEEGGAGYLPDID